jgi:hypothetical protein
VSAPFTSSRITSTPVVRLQPAGAWRIVLQQQRQQAQAGRGALLRRAEGGDGEQKQSGDEQPPASSSSSGSSPAPGAAPKRPPVADPAVAKGQLTAIITGAISIAFGVSLQHAPLAGSGRGPLGTQWGAAPPRPAPHATLGVPSILC